MLRPRDSCLLVLTHVVGAEVVDHFRSLARAWPWRDARLAIDADHGRVDAIPRDVPRFPFDARSLASLGYPTFEPGRITPGSTHLPAVLYAREVAAAHYWVIEYDVRFTGRWSKLFGAMASRSEDLLGTHVRTLDDDPSWYWWPTLHVPDPLPDHVARPSEHVRAFLPIYRISRRGLAAVDRAQRAGWRGHFECVLPTSLVAAGMTIGDLGFYSLDTMRHEPAFAAAGPQRNRLYHPVKPEKFRQVSHAE